MNIIRNKDNSGCFHIEGTFHNKFIAFLSLAALEITVKDTYAGRYCNLKAFNRSFYKYWKFYYDC